MAQQVGNCPASPSTDSCGSLPTSPTQQQLNAFYQCKIAASTGGNSNYCEFRDQPGVNNARGTAIVGPKAREAYRLLITNADGGQYAVEFENLIGYSSMNSASGSTGFSFNLSAGEDINSESYMSGFPQYSKGTAGQGVLNIRKGTATGTILASCTVNIRDDDNSAYIGRRRSHPYDGTWRTTPHCTGPVNCGWD